MSVAAVVVAGGRGARMGGGVPKQYLEVLGVPVLLRAIRPFLAHPRIGAVVVVLPPGDAAAPPPWLSALPVGIVAGGAERGDSVWSGLMQIAESFETVLVHDGARPFADAAVIDRVIGASGEGGAIAAIPVTDTIKAVDADRRVTGTPDRRHLWRAQTPQGFPRAALVDAYRRARAEGFAGTDDAAVFERYAGPVHVVDGSPRNIKVTVPDDLALAELLAGAAESHRSPVAPSFE